MKQTYSEPPSSTFVGVLSTDFPFSNPSERPILGSGAGPMRSREAALVKRALIVLALSRLPVVLLANGPDPANADLNHTEVTWRTNFAEVV
jgi:hypothetical protein